MSEHTVTDHTLLELARTTDTNLADLAAKRSRTVSTLESIQGELERFARGSLNLLQRGDEIDDQDLEELMRDWLTANPDDARNASCVRRTLDRLDAARTAIDTLNGEIATLDAVFHAAGGWTRFFLVQGGHIHSSLHCSTCNNGRQRTRFGWLPALSGRTEADAVAEHGAILCSVCYPSAPVAWTNHYDLKVAKQAADRCKGSGTLDYPMETARTGYYTGNYGICSHCGQRATLTRTGKMRAHKPQSTN